MYLSTKAILKYVYLLLLFAALPESNHAQLPISFTHYTQVNGLPDNTIRAIAQDKYGYIWIGTENGLTRFDGKYFTGFTGSPTFATLPSTDVYGIQNLDSNHLGIVTKYCLTIIDSRKMSSFNLIIPKGPYPYEKKVNHMRRVHANRNGEIIIVTRTGFYQYNKERNLVFRYDDYAMSEYDNALSFGEYSHWLDEETLILSGEKGIYKYNTRTKKVNKVSATDRSFLLFSIPELFIKDQDQFLFQPRKGCFIFFNYHSDLLIYVDEVKKIVTHSKTGLDSIGKNFTWRSNLFLLNDSMLLLTGKHKGLSILNLTPQTGVLRLDTSIYFTEKKVNCFLKDKSDKYWFGFADGLSCEKNSPINLQLHPSAGFYEVKSNRNSVLQTTFTNNHVYAASTVSGGVHQFDKKTLAFKRTIPLPFPAFGNKSLFAVEKWVGDSLICGSDAGLFLYDEKKNKSTYVDMPGWNPRYNWVADLFLDSKNNMWITTNKNEGCYVWKTTEKQPAWFAIDTALHGKFKEIYHITEDKEGNIWMAGLGIVRYNRKKNKIDYYLDKFSEGSSEPTPAGAIAIDANGLIWVANGSSGIACIEPGTNKTRLFGTKDGLPDQAVKDLHYYNGYVWITCKNGIVKIHCESKKITGVSNLKDVYYQNYFSGKLAFDSSTGSFFTGAGSSVIRFKPENTQYKNKGPELLMVFVKTGNDSTTWFPSSAITVKWKNKNVTLFYNAINFEDADFQKYAYRTISNGNTSNWIMQDDQRRIILNDLKKGSTIIEIKVFSPQNAWPEQVLRFQVNVIAPFWKTTWFLLICIIFLLAIAYAIYQYRVNHARRITKIRDDISKDLHDEIGATLSGIAMYSHLVKNNLANNDTETAKHSVSIIQSSATEMVNKLNDIIWLINPKTETLENIIQKLKDYAGNMCMAKNIIPAIVLQGAAASCKPPIETRKNIYLFCKEAINNVAKYSNASWLKMNFLLQDHSLEITISDDGIGFNMDTVKKGNGLDNMIKRAADMGAQCRIQTAPGQGCSISLSLKITQRGIEL